MIDIQLDLSEFVYGCDTGAGSRSLYTVGRCHRWYWVNGVAHLCRAATALKERDTPIVILNDTIAGRVIPLLDKRYEELS